MARKTGWIQRAIKHPGALRRYVKRKYGDKGFNKRGAIKREVLLKLAKHAKNPTIRRRAQLALTLRRLSKR
ncbi:MAG: hypothetical protein ACP5IE_01365 [Infirmifilum sp.]